MGISDISFPTLTLTDTIKGGFAARTQPLSPISKVSKKEHVCVARLSSATNPLHLCRVGDPGGQGLKAVVQGRVGQTCTRSPSAKGCVLCQAPGYQQRPWL